MNIEELALTAGKLDNQNQIQAAKEYSLKALNAAKANPKQLNDIYEYGLFGKAFLLMFEQNISNDQDDLQLISEISYLFLSKAIEDDIFKSRYLIDRLILLFNGEDFLKDTIKNALDLRVNILSPMNAPNMLNHQLQDNLYKMRIANFEHEHAVYNHIPFLMQKKLEYDHLLEINYFGNSKSKSEIILEGNIIHNKVYKYLENKLIKT